MEKTMKETHSTTMQMFDHLPGATVWLGREEKTGITIYAVTKNDDDGNLVSPTEETRTYYTMTAALLSYLDERRREGTGL